MALEAGDFGGNFDPDMGMQAIQDPMGLVKRLAQQGIQPPPDQEEGATPDDAHSSLGRLLAGPTQMAMANTGPTVSSTGGAGPAFGLPRLPSLPQDQPRPGEVASPGMGESGQGGPAPTRLGANLVPVPMLTGGARDTALGSPPPASEPLPVVPIGTTGEPSGSPALGRPTAAGRGGANEPVPTPRPRPATVMPPTPPPAAESPNAGGAVPTPRPRPEGPGIQPREDEGPEGDKIPKKATPTSGQKKDSFESKMDSLGKALAGLKPIKPQEPQKIYSPPPPRAAAHIQRVPPQTFAEYLRVAEPGNRKALGDLLRGGR